jgi:hypothetical protein
MSDASLPMKPGSSSTGWPSPCGAVASNGHNQVSEASSAKKRISSAELSMLGRPVWECRLAIGPS